MGTPAGTGQPYGGEGMKNTATLELMRSTVLVEKLDNHEVYEKHLTFARIMQENSEQDAPFVGSYDLDGYRIVKAGNAEKKTVCVDLDALWRDGSNGE